MTQRFGLKTGKVIGQSHLFSGRNCQDSLRFKELKVNNDRYLVGWISDGCSDGLYSEVGANLATEFLLNRTTELLSKDVPLEILPLFLFEDLVFYLKTIVQGQPNLSPQQQSVFIKDYLLFTLVGFVIGPRHTIVMAYGDGLVILNDEVYKRDFQDESPYPGYLLIDQKYLNPNRRPLNQYFDIYFTDTAFLNRLAIGSDAWLRELDLLEKIWGHKHPNQIQRNMNIWSDEKRLGDDATIIVVETSS